VRPADVVAVVGAGPIGLAATMTSHLFSPRHVIAIDTADSRLELAKQFGADEFLNPARDDVVARVRALTDGLGADVAIEAVGVPETFELCTQLIRPGGHVANIGVHGKPAALALDKLWAADVTITTGLVDTYSTPTLLQMVATGQLDVHPFATHRFQLDQIEAAYDTFARAADTNALKVVISK
jgi:alcohol dehydrogenase